MRWRVVASWLLLAVAPRAAHGQFYLPLPPPLGGDTVCAVKSVEQGDASIGCQEKWADTFASIRDSVSRAYTGRPYSRTLLRRRVPWGDSDRDLRGYYHANGLDYFQDFTSTLRDDRAYIATSVLAGLLGRTYFDFSVAKVVASAAEGEDEAERRATEDGIATIYRLVNNGGSAAMHLLLPMHAGGGTVSQRAFGFFLQAGAVGPLDRAEDMAATAGVGAELQISLAVRDGDYERKGELFLGMRAAAQHVFQDGVLDPESDDRSLPFYQVAVGIRQAGQTLVALTYTDVEREFRAFMPKIQVTFQINPGA